MFLEANRLLANKESNIVSIVLAECSVLGAHQYVMQFSGAL